MEQPRIAIVGAGLAGLVAALTAKKLGLNVTVLEQARDFKAIGGGIAIQSNGQRVLDALGLLQDFLPMMRLCSRGVLEVAGGKTLMSSDLDVLDIPFSRPAIVLRHQLQMHLFHAAQDLGVDVQMGVRCTGVSSESDSAHLWLADGHDQEFDIVIGSDGTRSVVRETLGIPTVKDFPGRAYIRGVANFRHDSPVLKEIWGQDGRLFGIAPLLGDETYFYCTAPLGDWEDVLSGGVEPWIRSWGDYGRNVLDLLYSVPDWRQVTYDEIQEVRMEHWCRSTVFLVGDAAHAMTPYLGQGANSAMVDALVLVQLLAQAIRTGAPLIDAAEEYEAIRVPFVNRVQKLSRRQGSLAVMEFPPARWVRDRAMSLGARLGWLSRKPMLAAAGYNPAEEEFFQNLMMPPVPDA